jgi:Protein of unknown function (DUF3551)
MRRLWYGLFGLAVLAASLLLAAPASHAAEYPWCAQYGSDNAATNCGFATLEQCRWTLSGNGGFCIRNPFHPDWDQSKVSKPKHAQR